jgi:ATP-dependent Clp protease ATP-binding subunit ClpC
MPQEGSNRYELYFEDPYLRISVGGRFTVRVVSYLANIVLLFAAGTFLISQITALRYLGAFLVLYFIDRVAHWGEADLPISELPAQGRVNLARILRPNARAMLGRVFDHGLIAKRDFFLSCADRLVGLDHIEEGLRRLDVKPAEFKAKLAEFLAAPVPADAVSREAYLRDTEALIGAAFAEALAGGHEFIELHDLFSALATMPADAMKRLFGMFSIEAGDLERALIFSSARRRFGALPRALGGFVFETNRRVRHRIMNRAWTSRPTPTLDRYGTDFTDLAREGLSGFLIGHDEEFTTLVETLSRSINPNALLVGDAGSGKEVIVRHLAFALVKDKVPKSLFDKRLVGLNIQELVAGAPPEELAARLKRIVEEIYMAGNIILYIPDIHNLVRTSGTAYLSAADMLMPIVMNNAFPVVGATYPREFKALVEPRSDFVGAFEVIHVNEITEADAERLLAYEGLLLEQSHRVTISFGAVKRAVALAKKYFRDKSLPGSAEELLKSALVDAEKKGEKTLTADFVTSVAETKTNVPLHEAAGAETAKLLHLEEIIHERFVDQEEAVTAVCEALREYRSGLARKGGPIASFLFVGPTGVGKTELAKALARVQFGSETLTARFDMTEYQSKESFTRFIGTPDGATRGALTEAVREKPYCLILLDEFEKAFPDILNLFLQVFDDGRLTDNLGRTVDFTNTIIIATSNAHSDIINESLAKGEPMTAIAEYLKKRLVDVFKPELLNRFSKIVIFKELAPADLEKIVVLNLEELADTVKDKGIVLTFDPAAVALLARLGYDPSFGARPLRRTIDEKVRSLLARAILQQEVGKGSRLKLVASGEALDLMPEA